MLVVAMNTITTAVVSSVQCICSCIEVEEVSGKGMRVLLASFMLVVAMNMTVLGPYSCS